MELQLANGDRRVKTDYVFTQSDGSSIRPASIIQWLAKFSKRKGLPHISPHAFGHTAASVLISQGTDVVTVFKMLGHANVSATEDIYSHVIEKSKQQASSTLAEQRKTEGRQRHLTDDFDALFFLCSPRVVPSAVWRQILSPKK